VGLPTYNRATTLKRAVESVLAQDYSPLELIISDNASTDGTQAICEDFCRRDNRIRYLRQATNVGAAANFKAVLDTARGEFFMWLADDDWLDSGYVRECTRALMQLPDHQLVCGLGKYFQERKDCFFETPINLSQDSPKQRVLAFYRQVGMNGTFYGLMHRKILANIKIDDSLGRDWLMMAQIAFLGKVKTLENVYVNRSLAGASRDVQQLALRGGLPRILARNAHLFIAFEAFRDICWVSPVYKTLAKWARVSLGIKSGLLVARRYGLPPRLNKSLEAWNKLRSRLILRTRLKRYMHSIMRKAL
jgi:glycosyltransferase involved in cell wall biosynthesis